MGRSHVDMFQPDAVTHTHTLNGLISLLKIILSFLRHVFLFKHKHKSSHGFTPQDIQDCPLSLLMAKLTLDLFPGMPSVWGIAWTLAASCVNESGDVRERSWHADWMRGVCLRPVSAHRSPFSLTSSRGDQRANGPYSKLDSVGGVIHSDPYLRLLVDSRKTAQL